MAMNFNYYELKPENNHFHIITTDLTHKCNMKCANCYLPNRVIPDMDTKQLFNLIKRLPFKCEIRLIGAEPTMREDLPEIIFQIKKLNHTPTLVTNGLKLSRLSYTKLLREAGLRFVTISLNGGDDDNLYKKIDGMFCAKKKIKALENLADLNFFINTSTIIVKGINEKVPKNLYRKLNILNIKKAVMRFRNVGQIGRYMLSKQNNYSYIELIDFIAKEFQLDKKHILKCNKMSGYREKNVLFFPVKSINKKNSSIYIKVTNWSPENFYFPDPNSKRRGRITQNFKIAPAFEHIVLNEFGY